jgi:hypothetical protein
MIRGQFWRWLVLPAVLLYAALALGSGLDRLAHERSVPEKWVPSVLRSGIHFAQARSFVEAGIPGSAIDQARQALVREPLNPSAPALFGMALLGKQDPAGADRAFRIAARLGWREPLTQLYWFQVSLAQNDLDNAVLRFDAIARQHPDAPYVTAMAASLERGDAGRDALARRIALGANWAQSYATLREGLTPQQIDARVDVLDRVARLNVSLGCEKLVQPVRVLAALDPVAGARLWREHCPRAASQALVIDGAFDQPLASQDAQVPFEWVAAGHGGLDVQLAPGDEGQALQVRSAASITLAFVEQLVPLPAGSYRLSWRMPDVDGARHDRVLAAIACDRDPAATGPAAGAERGGRMEQTVRIVPACKAPWLRFWITPGPTTVSIDDVRIDPL